MVGGIGHQQNLVSQVQAQATTQQATPVSKLTGGKSKKVKKEGEAKKSGGETSSTDESSEALYAQFGGMVSGFLKSKSKGKKDKVGRRYVGIDEAEEEGDVSETESAKESQSVEKAKMDSLQRTSGQRQVNKVSARYGRRGHGAAEVSLFINEWLRMKRSPAYSLELGEIMVEEGQENKVSPLILLAISAAETSYGKENIDGLMGVGDKEEGPEEQISMAALKFDMLRDKAEGHPYGCNK